MVKRQRSGSVVCPSCGKLVGVDEEKCPFCGRTKPGMFGFTAAFRNLGDLLGVVEIVIGGCVVLYLGTLLADMSGIRSEGMMRLFSPSQESLLRFGASGAIPVFGAGRWWTVLSAGWLHGGVLHILFNMMWVRSLAPVCVAIYGPGRTILLYTGSSVLGFVLSTASVYSPIFGQASLTVGASAAVFGLLGATVHAGKRGIASQIGQQAWMYAVVLFVFGLVFPGVDNWAHLGGYLGGYLGAQILDPRKPERTDHQILALACLVATVVSILVSYFAWPPVPA